jgi:hypothetical protein
MWLMNLGLSYRVICTFLVGLLLLTGSPARANDASESDALISRGLELRHAGQDRQALPLFQEAAEKNKTPRALAQVGLCEFALGLWVEGEDHLQQALATRTDPWIRKNERQLKRALDDIQEKLGSLDIWGEPAGAKVAIDGRAVGTLPLERPLRLAAGRHSLVIEATGFLPDSRFVQVPVRTVAREHAALAPAPRMATQPPPPPPALAPPPVEKQPASPTLTAKRSDEEPAASPIYTRWWFWTAIGVVAVAAGGTAYLLLSRKDQCDSSAGGSCVAW